MQALRGGGGSDRHERMTVAAELSTALHHSRDGEREPFVGLRSLTGRIGLTLPCCLSAGTGDGASGRVDGSVLDESYEMRQRSAASSVATESSSTPVSFQAMVISLGGKTLMIDAIPDALVLLLVEDVARLLALPDTCFYLTVGVCFVGTFSVVSLQFSSKSRCKIWLLIFFTPIAGTACDRGIMDEAAGRAFVQRFAQQG